MSQENVEMTNALLSANWGDIADLPDYVNLPTGSYKVGIKKAEIVQPKPDDADGDISIRVHTEHMETLEVAEGTEHPQVGSLSMFSYKGAKGVQRFKKDFGPIGEAIGAASPADLLDRMEGLELGITVQQSANKENPDRPFTNLRTAVLI